MVARKRLVLVPLAGLAFLVALGLRKGRQSVVGGGWPVNLAHRGASAVVPEMTLDELRGVDAGHNFSPDGGTLPYRGLGLRIPTLAEVLQEFPGVALNIDMKADHPGIEAAVLGVLREADAEERALVVSSRHGAVRRFRR